jgi:hypothetical protein
MCRGTTPLAVIRELFYAADQRKFFENQQSGQSGVIRHSALRSTPHRPGEQTLRRYGTFRREFTFIGFSFEFPNHKGHARALIHRSDLRNTSSTAELFAERLHSLSEQVPLPTLVYGTQRPRLIISSTSPSRLGSTTCTTSTTSIRSKDRGMKGRLNIGRRQEFQQQSSKSAVPRTIKLPAPPPSAVGSFAKDAIADLDKLLIHCNESSEQSGAKPMGDVAADHSPQTSRVSATLTMICRVFVDVPTALTKVRPLP